MRVSLRFAAVAVMGYAARMTPSVFPFMEVRAGFWGGSYDSGSTVYAYDPDVSIGDRPGSSSSRDQTAF